MGNDDMDELFELDEDPLDDSFRELCSRLEGVKGITRADVMNLFDDIVKTAATGLITPRQANGRVKDIVTSWPEEELIGYCKEVKNGKQPQTGNRQFVIHRRFPYNPD